MLSQTAEYALRAVASLAPTAGRLIPTTDLAKLADVPPPYLAKVLQQLSGADIIRGRRGVGGGYTLNRSPEDINLLEVVLAVGPLREPRSRQQVEALGDGLTDLHALIDGSIAELRTRLERTTVAQVAQDTDAVREGDAGRASSSNGSSNGHRHAPGSDARGSNGSAKGSTNGTFSRGNGSMVGSTTF